MVECVKKIRLRDLNVYSPKRAADWRVSVNLEVPGEILSFHFVFSLCCIDTHDEWIVVPQPMGTPTHTRRKDRLSYSHEEFSIDLTQVTSTAGGAVRLSSTCVSSSLIARHHFQSAPQPEVLHELELEISRPALLLSTALKRGDPNVPEHERNAFDELIRAFVNNARILVRNAGDGWQ
jgi:polynucleotide 5'-triphosphatase